VRPRHGAEFLGPDDAGEAHEIPHRVLVGTQPLISKMFPVERIGKGDVNRILEN